MYTSDFIIPFKDFLCAFGFSYLYYYQGCKSEIVKNRLSTDIEPEKDVTSLNHLLTINDEEYNKTEGSSIDNKADEKQEEDFSSSWYAKRREGAM